VVCHGRVGLLHRLANLVLEQEIRGRRTFGCVRVARFLDPPPLWTLPFLGVVGFAFADTVGLYGNNWELRGRRHHLLHVQLRVHPHRWTGSERRSHWWHGLHNLERRGSKAMKRMSILVTDFCAFSQGIREGTKLAEELFNEIFLMSERDDE
jgi:hypothetical protein